LKITKIIREIAQSPARVIEELASGENHGDSVFRFIKRFIILQVKPRISDSSTFTGDGGNNFERFETSFVYSLSPIEN